MGANGMKHTLVVALVTATLVAGLIVYRTERVAGQNQQSPEQTLLAQAKGHPLAKLGPWLSNLSDEYQQFASANGGRSRSAFKSRNPALKVRDGFVVVDGVANDPVALTRTLTAIGATNIHGGGVL